MVAVVWLDVIHVICIVAIVIVVDHCNVVAWQLLINVKVHPKTLEDMISQVQMLAWMLALLIVRAGTRQKQSSWCVDKDDVLLGVIGKRPDDDLKRVEVKEDRYTM